MLSELLDVEDVIAQILVTEGYVSVESSKKYQLNLKLKPDGA